MGTFWGKRGKAPGRGTKQRVSGPLLVFLCFLFLCLFPPNSAGAETLVVGVAANFILPFRTMVRVFEEKTSIHVDAIFTSTGNLYTQIRNGAPYDLFLAADQDRPGRLHRDGLAQRPFIYAKGKVVLWTSLKTRNRCGKPWQEMVVHSSVEQIGTANPETAPYGAAAVEALKRAGLWDTVKPKLVYAQSIAQAFQYAQSRSVDASFCALSSALSPQGRAGCHFTVAEAPAIVQAACVIKGKGRGAAAERFAAFLVSAEAAAIKRKYGYE